MENVGTARPDLGGDDLGDVRKELVEFHSVLVAGPVPVLDIFQLDAENGGLQSVEATVYSFNLVDVFFLGAVVGEQAGSAGEFVIVSDDGAAVAICPEVLSWIETECSGQA